MLDYLKKHIIEEIDDAIDYYEKAIEKKGTACGACKRAYKDVQ